MNDRKAAPRSSAPDTKLNPTSDDTASARLPYSPPEILDLGFGTDLTGWSSSGPFHDGSSEQGRSWKQ